MRSVGLKIIKYLNNGPIYGLVPLKGRSPQVLINIVKYRINGVLTI